MCAWSYEDLENACRKARGEPSFQLWTLLEEESELDQKTFVDAVTRRLASGSIMLLLIGDGILEGVEKLTAHLQLHAGMHCGLALVELSLWSAPDGGLLVIPRVPMKTVIIERGVVTIDGTGMVRVSAPTRPASSTAPARPSTQSEAEFYDRFGAGFPSLVEELRRFLSNLGPAGISVEFRKSAVLRFRPTPDVAASAGFIDAAGQVWFNDAWTAASRTGRPTAAQRYFDAVASAAGGRVVPATESRTANVVDPNGKVITAARLLPFGEIWKDAIATFVSDLSRPGQPQLV